MPNRRSNLRCVMMRDRPLPATGRPRNAEASIVPSRARACERCACTCLPQSRARPRTRANDPCAWARPAPSLLTTSTAAPASPAATPAAPPERARRHRRARDTGAEPGLISDFADDAKTIAGLTNATAHVAAFSPRLAAVPTVPPGPRRLSRYCTGVPVAFTHEPVANATDPSSATHDAGAPARNTV